MKTKGGGELKYKYSATRGPDFTYSWKNNIPIKLYSFTISDNGEWLVGESDYKIIRIRVKTGEALTIDSIHRSGVEKNAELSISNNGRYIAVSMINDSKKFTIYDVSTCTASSNQEEPAAGCGKKELYDFISRSMPNTLPPSELHFSSDASQLSLKVQRPNAVAQRIVLIPFGQQYSKLDYLALGDSYSSGEGDTEQNVLGEKHYIKNTDTEENMELGIPREKCHVSSRSYPYLLAQSWNTKSFKNIACSGAIVDDIAGQGDYFGQENRLALFNEEARAEFQRDAIDYFIPGRERQIRFIERNKPKAVTITISGNDIGFSDVMTKCVLTKTRSCLEAEDPLAQSILGLKIQDKFEDLKKLYTEIHNASRQTKIYVIGYPQFIDHPNSKCGPNVQLDEKERELVYQGVKYINKVIEASAKATGVKYISIEDSLKNNALCSSADKIHVTGTAFWGKSELQESFHPNHLGHLDIKASIVTSLLPNDLLSYNYCGDSRGILCPSADIQAPTIPEYFRPGTIEGKFKSYQMISKKEVLRSEVIQSQIDFLKPNSVVMLELHSQPISLGQFDANDKGEAKMQFSIPSDIMPGLHTLHLHATTASGERIDFSQDLLVKATDKDIDGDNILDSSDKCLFIDPIGIDKDKDTKDDACDSYISPPSLGSPTLEVNEKVNYTNQRSLKVSGKAETGAWVTVQIDDADPQTKTLETKIQLFSVGYEATLDVSHLNEGELIVKAFLTNDAEVGPSKEVRIIKDTQSPSTSYTLNPNLNSYGWSNEDVLVSFTSTDNYVGVKDFTLSAYGAQNIPKTTLNNPKPILISSEGSTNLAYFAQDKWENVENKKSLNLSIDKTSPTIAIQKGEDVFNLFDGRIFGTSSDSLSGVESVEVHLFHKSSKAKFTLPAFCRKSCSEWEVTTDKLPNGLYEINTFATDKASNKSSVAKADKIIFNLPWRFWW